MRIMVLIMMNVRRVGTLRWKCDRLALNRRKGRCGLCVMAKSEEKLKRLAIFVSGGGSNFRKLYEACGNGYICGKCVHVVTNVLECPAAEFARSQNIPVALFPSNVESLELESNALIKTLKDDDQVDFILLAGYLKLLPPEFIKAFPKSILNIHPGLLPAFGGKGFYGRKVHEAVLQSGAKFSDVGATVHFVDEEYDKGSILDQRVVPVFADDTPQSLAVRILKQEHELYSFCTNALCDGRIKWNKNVKISMSRAQRLLRWGIIGTGDIANTFAKDLIEHAADISILTSVLSRSREKALSFGKNHNIQETHCFSEFESFAESDIDVCYIATPHTSHASDALKCLNHNKGVLVEKPLALRAEDAAAVFQKAQEKRLFVMEAVWTRFIPAMKTTIEYIRSSGIGHVMSIDVDFGFKGTNAPERLKNPKLGGGALFDLGTYAFHLGTLFSHKNPNPAIPRIIHSSAQRLNNGVDEVFHAILSYPSEAKGEEAILNMRLAINEKTSCSAFIHGKKGHVLLHPPFHCPDMVSINGKTEIFAKAGHGLHYQTREVYDCIKKGKLESDFVPWNESLNWAATFDELTSSSSTGSFF